MVLKTQLYRPSPLMISGLAVGIFLVLDLALVINAGPSEPRVPPGVWGDDRFDLYCLFGCLCALTCFFVRRHGFPHSRFGEPDAESPVNGALEAAFEHSPEGLILIDASGRVERANRVCREWFEAHAIDAAGSTANDLLEEISLVSENPDDWEELRDPGKDDRFTGETRIVLTGPDRRVLSLSGENLDGGSLLLRISDVTQQQELEMEFRRSQKMVSLGRLAMEVSHDFNNLLTGINGNLAILEMELESRRIDIAERKNLQFAIRAGNRAAELVRQLLKFSRSDQEQICTFNVKSLIGEVMGILGTSLDATVRLDKRITPELWNVRGDSDMLSQVLVNVITNARDAVSDHGRIRILADNVVFRPGGDEPAGKYVRIAIEDNGSGMPDDVKRRIFEPFFTTKGEGKGTGLGLSSSLKIIKRMGGWIHVESEPSLGTRFEIFVPKGADPKKKGKQSHALPKRFLESTSSGETILVVDDEPEVQLVAVCLLKRMGYRTMVAGNGEEALQIYREHGDKIDLVMLDLTMPKLSGKETFARLRSEFTHVPVLICSGHAVELASFENTGSVPEGFVQKPYRIETVTQSIRELLDKTATVA